MRAYSDAARQLVELEAARLPDLSGVIVLVPHFHGVGGFLRALRAHVDVPVFLPPRLTTLPALAASVASATPMQPASHRLSLLHDLLSRFDWLAEEALWPLASELLELVESLDAALLSPPPDFDAFEAQLQVLGRRFRNRPMSREAELVYRVWRALHLGPPGAIRDYAARLGTWSREADQPLYILGEQHFTRLETRFLAQRAVRQLPMQPYAPERLALARAAWLSDSTEHHARARALEWAAMHPVSALAGRVEMHGAVSLEDEARFVAGRVRRWVAEGHESIGLVALDRVTARRLRALLERDAILIRDETGWTFSTAQVSHVLDRFFALIEDDCYFRDLLDLLKSPFVFANTDPEALRDVLPEFERAIHRRSQARGLPAFQGLARELGLAGLEGPLAALGAALAEIPRGRRLGLAAWLDALLRAMDCLGAISAWRGDIAGVQLLGLLQGLRGELERDEARYDFAQWRAWLDLQLDRATFIDQDIDSPIRLTHLEAARGRDFDAVVILGADATRLPDRAVGGPLGEAARLELGLPGLAEAQERLRATLLDVLGNVDQVLFTWQHQVRGEVNPPCPWLESLATFHRVAYGHDLSVTPALASCDALPTSTSVASPPAPNLDVLPRVVTASAWQTLIDCPYRFFIRHGLGLGEADEVAEELEKRHYGELLHLILRRFHERFPSLAEATRDDLAKALATIGDEVFAQAGFGGFLARAWRERWRRHQDAYLDWALARAAAGCAWRAAETEFERVLPLGHGELTLKGRIDRLDDTPDGPAVLDYKAQSGQSLRDRMRNPGESVQLAFYMLLTEARHAGFVGLDDERVTTLELKAADGHAESEANRLRTVFDALAAGARLPANGATTTCRGCEVRGLCRKDHWPDV
jgi:ATP-dependent helicase/nuclease subunit B